MKKIGLLTVYSFNYGSFFQATSLYRYLEDHGYDCEFINERFKKKQWGNLRLLYTFHDLLPGFMRGLVGKLLPQYVTYLRLQKDVAAYRESDPKKTKMAELTKAYDLVLLGADELWSASPRSIRYTPEYFGYGIRCPHVSYATSGCLFDRKDRKLCEKAAEGLKTFARIAVRDSYTAQVVEELTGKRPAVVLDPALLYPWYVKETFSAGDSAEAAHVRTRERGDYVLLYGSEYDMEQRAFIKAEAKRRNARICALGWPQDFADDFLDPQTAEEFQSCFADAVYCFPATFHGTVFSVTHHKPFVTMGNDLRGKKIGMLLEQIGLTDRLFRADTSYGEIDYEAVEARLEGLRKISGMYLKEVLEGNG